MKIRALRFPLFLLLVLSMTGCVQNITKHQAVNGIVDLTQWDPDSNSIVSLEGNWEFYWKELLTPEDFAQKNHPAPRYVRVPSTWEKLKKNNKSLSDLYYIGYGTYRLRIKVPEKKRLYSIRTYALINAYKIWVNGKLLDEVGKVSRDPAKMVSEWRSTELPVEINSEYAEIIIQIANNKNNLGGFWTPISFGSYLRIAEYRDMVITIDNIMLGFLLFISLYYFGVYLVRKEEKENIIFSLFCFVMTLRIITLGEQRLLFHILPQHGEIIWRLAQFSFFVAPAFLFQFVYEIYPDLLFKKVYQTANLYSALIIISVALFPIPWIGIMMTPVTVMIVIYVFLSTTIIMRALLRKEENALLFLFSIPILILPVVNDILNLENVITTGFFAGYGITGFAVIQSILLLRKYGVAFNNANKLTEELRESRDNLEIKVEDRTMELNRAYERMKTAYKDAELANLNKSRFLANMSHELRTPMNSINGIVDLIRFGSYDRDEDIITGYENLIFLLKNEIEKDNGNKETIQAIIKDMEDQMDFISDDGNFKRYYLNQLIEKLKGLHLAENPKIKENLEILQKNINEEEKDLVTSYKRVKDSGEYLLGLIDAVLNISKIESGRIEIRKSHIKIKDLLNTVLQNAKDYAHAKKKGHLRIIGGVDETVPEFVYLDNQKTKQILFNLLSNSIKFTISGTVELKIDKKDNFLYFFVSDTGIGIEEPEKKKIFLEFERTSSAKDIEGTGLGLVVSRKLVNLQGGEMDFESEYNKGSKFWFTIPSNDESRDI